MPLAGSKTRTLTPFWSTRDGVTAQLYLGHVIEVLSQLPPRSVQTCITSPPYWGLRSYATGDNKSYELGSEPSPDCNTSGQAQCGKCFVCNMVAVFRGVRRVLRDDGTLWLNLGDSYSGGGGFYPNAPSNREGRRQAAAQDNGSGEKPKSIPYRGMPSGNLVGVPWRVALALQADGWVLRQDIIWHKPAPMPESVRNRCTKAMNMSSS
jgi:DNA modification methylase